MCGICGTINSTPLESDEIDRIKSVNAAMAHRGPDGAGFYENQHMMLAMRRLSIIDLEGGWQPLYNEDKSLVLVANGEVYNFIELREELEKNGHQFNTDSDCEMILHLYEQYDLEFVDHLRGMYAFALWDMNKQRMIVVRDRMGEKPLYLWTDNSSLTFASELKALIPHIPSVELDPDAINLYFHYHYVPDPITPIKGIRKLQPGHMLIIDVNPWKITECQYWDMMDAKPRHGDPIEAIKQELDTVSEQIVRSDVPIGIALSGGFDSGALAVITSEKYPGKMHAFTVGYEEDHRGDERADARRLTDYLDIPFHEIVISTQDMVDFFPELVHHSDDPIADIAAFGYYTISRVAREHDTPVLLQGQGGDELFWGYDWPTKSAKDSIIKHELQQGVNPFRWLQIRKDYLPDFPNSIHPKAWQAWLRQIRNPQNEKHIRWSNISDSASDRMVFYNATDYFRWTKDHVSWIYTDAFINHINKDLPESLFTFEQPWQELPSLHTKLISQTYLLENGIALGDRLSMASSVELRLPFVDYQLVETVIGHRKTKPDYMLPGKYWFRQALSDRVPDWLGTGPKRGFTPPVNSWYHAILDTYGKTLDGGYLERSGILTKEAITAFIGKTINIEMAYKAVLLELWCRDFIEQTPVFNDRTSYELH